jgi:phage terminase large subunit-like protein
MTLQSWDTASKGGPDNDWSVCTTWIVTRTKLWYLVDVWRQRVEFPTLKANVQTLAEGTRGVFWSRTPAPGPRSFKSCEGGFRESSP